MVTKKTVYVTHDGATFDSELEAQRHEVVELFASEFGVYASGRAALLDALRDALIAGWVLTAPPAVSEGKS